MFDKIKLMTGKVFSDATEEETKKNNEYNKNFHKFIVTINKILRVGFIPFRTIMIIVCLAFGSYVKDVEITNDFLPPYIWFFVEGIVNTVLLFIYVYFLFDIMKQKKKLPNPNNASDVKEKNNIIRSNNNIMSVIGEAKSTYLLYPEGIFAVVWMLIGIILFQRIHVDETTHLVINLIFYTKLVMFVFTTCALIFTSLNMFFNDDQFMETETEVVNV